MSMARRLHYEGIIYRFKFLMLATLICAALTIAGFIVGQMSESQYHWDDLVHLEFTSAFFTGVYGMWNIFIFALIILYAPSHKQWPSAAGNGANGSSIHDSATGITRIHPIYWGYINENRVLRGVKCIERSVRYHAFFMRKSNENVAFSSFWPHNNYSNKPALFYV